MTVGKGLKRRLVDNCGLLALDLVGQQFGSLAIISRKTEGTTFNLKVEVRCSRCGQTHMGRFHNMRKRPETEACPHCNGRKPVTVPKWLYNRCQAQRIRCVTASGTRFDCYGARGVEFRFADVNEAARWIAENLGVPDDRSLQLDRINNDGHYEPGNLRWAHRITQMNNTRPSLLKHGRQRFISFREKYPQVRYSDSTLARLILRMSDEEIEARWHLPSNKPKGKYGTFSMQGPYRDLPPMGA